MGEQDATEPRRGPRVLGPASLAVLAVALVWHFAPFPWPVNRFDTGVQLCGADLVRAGRTPYADFQTLYTPGAYYLNAGAFAVLGRSIGVYVGVDSLLLALQTWAAWHLAARISGAALPALLAAAAGLVFRYPYPSVLLAMAALLAAARPATASVRRRAIVSGVLAGCAGWFRQDFGAVAAIAAAVTIATAQADDPLPRRVRWAVLSGACAAATLTLLLLSPLLRAPGRLWEGLVVNPLATAPFRDSSAGFTAVALAQPHFLVLALLAVLLGALGVAAAVAPGRVRGILRPETDVALLAGTAVLALYAFRYLLLRTDLHHLVPVALLAVALAGVSLRGGGRMRLPTLVTLLAAAAAVALPGWTLLGARVAHWSGRRKADLESLGDVLPGASALYMTHRDAANYRTLLATLRELAGPKAPFLAACARHDRIHDQDLLVYFAMDQLPPVRDYHFDPGVTTRPEVQEGIIDDAERAGVRIAVLYDSNDAAQPEPSALPLDAWLTDTFREWGPPIGRYRIRVR